ncbi:sulfatase [Algoriphagus sediminis]|nr:sulfatase [Algoriphagus sediminis]
MTALKAVYLPLLIAFNLNFFPAKAQEKPNILFILTDDLGYTDLGSYGNLFNETPNIDSLAQGGVRFTEAYTASPVCSPSRVALLTGIHPARVGLTNFLVGKRTDENSSIDPPENWTLGLDGAYVTLAEYLSDQGYQTGFVGKWHLGNKEGQNPWEQGFDFSRMISKNGLDYYNYSIAEDGFEKLFEDDGTYYLTDRLTDYGQEFLEKQKDDKPFFLFMSYSAPHVLLIPRSDKLGKYLWKYEEFNGKYNPSYAAMIESVDDGVGALVQSLESRGMLENTLVIFTSDNGGVGLPELGPIPTNLEPLRAWKGHNFEGGVRVPAIIYWKGKFEPGRIIEDYFTNSDYFATIRDLIENGEIYEDGQSLLPIINGSNEPSDRALFWHYPHFSNQLGIPSAAIRKGDWKLIYFFESGEKELYNLKEDISEGKNQSNAEMEIRDELWSLLKNWLIETNAPLPISKETGKPVVLSE